MNINVIQMPETKVWTDRFKSYTTTYTNGFPVHVRRVWSCTDCGNEVGGHFGNKVYGDVRAKRCNGCLNKNDPMTQMCILTTGLTPAAYQQRFKRAWND